MFILRRITKNGTQLNTFIGEYYLVATIEKNKEEFSNITKLWPEDDLYDVYGVVSYDDGNSIMPLYIGSEYYIMTGDGRTFDNLTKK